MIATRTRSRIASSLIFCGPVRNVRLRSRLHPRTHVVGLFVGLRRPRPARILFDALPQLRNASERFITRDASVDVLRAALAELSSKAKILVAFIYGSVAAGRHTPASDIDLMVIGRVELADLLPALGPIQERLGREVNPTIYRPEELAAPRSFVRRVLDGPKIMLVGTDDDIAKLAGKPVAHEARPESRGNRRPARGR